MERIRKEIAFSNDIERILSGDNIFNYSVRSSCEVIKKGSVKNENTKC